MDGVSARAYGSQGQQRSLVLALKLAEADVLEQEGGEAPVILLDDVMSELDAGRQHYLLNRLDGRQVFLTCCEPARSSAWRKARCLKCGEEKFMYLHLGQDTVIKMDEIVGIFNMETSTISKTTRNYLAQAEKAGKVVNVSMELPKSFVLCRDSQNRETVYISQISSSTLLKRTGYIDEISNV